MSSTTVDAWRREVLCLRAALVLTAVNAPDAPAEEFPLAKVNAIFETKAQALPGAVYKYVWPRTDLTVKVGLVTVSPGLALGSWAGFIATTERRAELLSFPSRSVTMDKGHVEVMGDLVLLETEVDPVVRELQARGLKVTAIHNHLLGETPRLIYVHFMGAGDAVELAKALKAALEKTATPVGPRPQPPAASEPAPRWVSEVEAALGRAGKFSNGILSVSVARAGEVKVGDIPMPPAMGLASAMNFQAADGQVASAGDLVLVAGEVNRVISALNAHGIEVTAIHSHMLDDAPHLFFLHYWALGSPAVVGEGLKAALGQIRVAA